MRKLSIKEIVKFKGKSERGRITFVSNLKTSVITPKTDGGGDYWISCLSAISNGYKNNDNSVILDRIHILEDKYEAADSKRTKDMYERNISILYKYEDIDYSKWIPTEDISLVKKHKADFILKISSLEIKAIPHHVFTFQNEENNEIGAIWFIAQLDGFSKAELAMFTDILYRYLEQNFSTKHNINPNYCIAVDVVNGTDVNYNQILTNEVTSELDSTIEEIEKLM